MAEKAARKGAFHKDHPRYKWIALSNTTLGILMATINGSIVLISLPAIFNGLRIAHGFAWILIVVGEMTGVPTGLGSVVMDGRTLSRTDLVITGMIVIGACGFITDRIIVAVSNRLLSWSPQHLE